MGSLADRIYRFVTVPPSLADPEEMRVARLLQKMVPMLVVSAAINLVGSLIANENLIRYSSIFCATMGLSIVGLLILRRGKARRAALAVVMLGWIFTSIFCLTGGGLRAPIFLLYTVITYAAGILLGKRALWRTTILTMLTVCGMAVLEGNGLLPPSTLVITPTSLFFNYTSLLVLVWSLQHILTSSLNEALKQSRDELSSRTKAEQSLVENERRLRQIIDLVPHFIFAKDENGKFLLVNKAVADAYGTTVEELTGKTDADFAKSEEEHRHFREDDLAVIHSGKPKLIPEETITDAAGRVRLLSTQKIPFAVSDSSSMALIGVSVDITDREKAERTLRASEEQYRQLFEMESDALLLIENETGNILEANNASSALYGYSHSELLSLNNCDLSAEPEKTRLATTETPISPEHLLTIPLRLHRKKDGTVFPVEVTARFFLRDGRPVHIASNRDITQRITSDEQLRRAQSMLAQILDSVPQSVFWKDREGKFLGCNKQFARAAGFENPSQVLGKTDFEITSSSGLAETYRADDQDVLDHGQPKKHIVEQTSVGNGSVRWLETTKIPLRGDDGQVYGVLGVFEDITERRQGVEILEQERNLLRTLIDTLPSSVYIYIKDFECRYVINNLAHLKSMGLSSQEEAVGKTSLDFYPKQYATMFIEDEREVIRTGEGFINKEELSISKSGEGVRWHLTTKIPLRDSTGKIVGLVGMSSDITERKRIEEALRESEERFRSLYDNATIGLYRTTPDGRIIISNPAVLRMLGYDSLEDLTKRNLEDPEFDPTYNRSEFRERLERDGMIVGLESMWHRRDGTAIFVRESAKVVHDAEGRILCYDGTVEDITERKLAEEALRKSEFRLKQSQRVAELGHYELDVETGTWTSSDVLNDVLGIDDSYEKNVESWLDIIHPEDRLSMSAYFSDHVLKERKPFDIEYRIVRKRDSVERWVHGLGQLQMDMNGNPVKMFGVIQDISERRVAEEALASERERLAVTLRSIGDGVITTDLEGCITLMNKVAEQMTGWPLQDAMGKPLAEVFSIVDEYSREPRKNPVQEVLETGQVIELANHTMLVNRAGREIIVADSGAPIFDQQSKIVGVVLVFRDMTEKQRLIENLQRAEKLQSLGVLAGGLAHDFNNLLGGIFGYLELAQQHLGANEKSKRYIEKALTTFNRARDLTQQLLTFSKGGAPNRKAGSLGSVLKENALFALSGSNVSPHFNLDTDLWLCDFDENQVGQVIDNLVINAQQAMPLGGSITLDAHNLMLTSESSVPLKEGKYVRFSVTDTGTGIPPNILPRIFDPFFTTKQKGSGLGLTTVYSIIQKHEGTITVESKQDKGTTFHVYLPASEAKTVEAVKAVPMADKGIGYILVMDDEDFILETTQDMLESMGYQTRCVRDGQEALTQVQNAAAEGRPFDAVIMDLTIPGGMGGKEAIRKLRELYPKMTAFVASGYSSDPVLSKPNEFGFTDKLQKPFRLDELSQLLKKHLRGGKR